MDKKLLSIFGKLVEIKNAGVHAGVSSPKVIDLVGRIKKVVNNIELSLNDPAPENSFDPELHLKESTYYKEPKKKRGPKTKK